MTIHEHLLNVNGRQIACIAARKWASQYKTAQEVWDNCDNTDWLFWWASRMDQHEGCIKAAREIADSVKHLNNMYAVNAAKLAKAMTYNPYTTHNSYIAAYVAAHAISAVCDIQYDISIAYEAKLKQKELNLSILRKHLVCPWHETETEIKYESK